MENIAKMKEELERAKMELAIMYEISNAMRTTLKLDEILYIILTGVTAHIGLGFNRAILFLVNEAEGLIEGKMSIGPDNIEEASLIWGQIEHRKMDLDDLIDAYKVSKSAVESRFNQQIKHLKISLKEQPQGLLVQGVLKGMPLHITKETIQDYRNDSIIQILNTNELILVPLKKKDKVNGIILADNFITKKPITKDDIRILIMLGNQAGLAIENAQLYEQQVLRAHSDSLTGLWNHVYFHQLLQRELEKAMPSQNPLSLIILDIDDFKIYNDSLGHPSGDKLLKELVLLLKNQSRKMDFVCRYGGEEFTIILPQTDKKEAFLIAERLRQDIQKYPFLHREILPKKTLTVSIGIAGFPEDGTTASELISYSDEALYKAKRKGKNNTCG